MRETFYYEPNKEPATAERMEMFTNEFTYGLKAILAAEESGFLSIEDLKKLHDEFGDFLFDIDKPKPILRVIKNAFMITGVQFKQECQQQLREAVPENESQIHEKAQAMLDLVDYFYDNIQNESYQASSDTIINTIMPELIQKIKDFFRRFPNPLVNPNDNTETQV